MKFHAEVWKEANCLRNSWKCCGWSNECLRNLWMVPKITTDKNELAKFAQVAVFMNGKYHIEEIMYHMDLRRAQLLQIIDKFRSIVVRHEHEDPALTMYYEPIRRWKLNLSVELLSSASSTSWAYVAKIYFYFLMLLQILLPIPWFFRWLLTYE